MLDIEQIKRIIPHRPPFLLLTRVSEIGEDYARGEWDLTGDEDFFKGHFPGNKILPGVLMIESMAQLGSIIMLSREEYRGRTPIFGGIKNARFKAMAVPPVKLTLETRITKSRGSLGFGAGKIFVDGDVACSAEMSYYIK